MDLRLIDEINFFRIFNSEAKNRISSFSFTKIYKDPLFVAKTNWLISVNTNADATAYQVLFTWSTGNGYFRYYDKANDKIVTIQDVAGWQARHYYFGPENEPENHCWHSAYAGDNRITLAYKFPGHGKHDPRDQQARDLRDLLIEEIESVD